MATIADLIGRQFGRLLVLRRAPNKNDRVQWVCACECGNTVTTYSKTLINGRTRSCGCLLREVSTQKATTHGMNRSREHKAWMQMKCRCNNPNATGYEHYGGRGIGVCDRWNTSFEMFLEDMGPCPSGHTIEREDVNKGYSPENCSWLPRSLQNRNTTRSLRIQLDGCEMDIVDAAALYGLTYQQAYKRWRRYAVPAHGVMVPEDVFTLENLGFAQKPTSTISP